MSSLNDGEHGRRHNKRPREEEEGASIEGGGGNAASGGGNAAANTVERRVRARGNHEEESVLSYTNEDGEAVDDFIPWSLNDPNPPSQIKSSALKKLEGTRLEPIKKLEPYPQSFITTTIASSNAMLTALLNIKQREVSYLRFDSQVVLRDSNGKAVTDDSTGKDKTVAFIPRSIRGKNPVQSSADVREDDRIVAALADSQAAHDMHQTAMAAHIKKVAGLELTIRKEKLGDLFLDLAFELAKQSYIFLKETKVLRTKMERDQLAHLSVLLTLRSLSESDEESLRNTRTDLTSAYTRKHGLDLTEDGMEARMNSNSSREIKGILQPLLIGATAGLIKVHDRRDDFRAGHAALREYAEMQQQIEANNELERGKEEEDAMTQAMEKFMEDFSKIASDKHINRMKSILKVKYSAGGENHASAKRNNGAGRPTRPAANSNGNSRKGSARPSHNSSKQQRGKEKNGKSQNHKKKHQNQNDNSTRGRSRSRSTNRSRGTRRNSRSRSNSRVRFSRKDEAKARRDNQRDEWRRSDHYRDNDGNGRQRRNNNSQGGGRSRRNEGYDDGYYDGHQQRRPSASSSDYYRRRDSSRSRSRSRSSRGDRGSRGDRNSGWRGGGARRR